MILAQLSDSQLQPLLYAKVTKYMLHGPCSIDNSQAKCMVNRKCSKHFPNVIFQKSDKLYNFISPNNSPKIINSKLA